MSWDEFLKISLDKGVYAILLLVLGLWINKKLSKYKSDLEENAQTKILIAKSRLPSFSSLWEITEITSPTRNNKLDDDTRDALNASLREWYYVKGNGLYLTNELRNIYLQARDSLKARSTDALSEEEITQRFSNLRTKLKNELGIYGYFKDKNV